MTLKRQEMRRRPETTSGPHPCATNAITVRSPPGQAFPIRLNLETAHLHGIGTAPLARGIARPGTDVAWRVSAYLMPVTLVLGLARWGADVAWRVPTSLRSALPPLRQALSCTLSYACADGTSTGSASRYKG